MNEFYITMGQEHIHKVDGKIIDKDCVAVITAPDHTEARKIALDLFGTKFCTSYESSGFTSEALKYYPRGLIHVN